MSKRLTITITDAAAAAIERLRSIEHRSASNCIAAIIERSLPELRQEWQTTGAATSLKKKNSRRYDAEIENMEL